MATQDELKQQVAKAAVEYVKGGIIGVGTGSTANFFIDELAKVKSKIDGAVASSEATAQRLRAHGIEVFGVNLAHVRRESPRVGENQVYKITFNACTAELDIGPDYLQALRDALIKPVY